MEIRKIAGNHYADGYMRSKERFYFEFTNQVTTSPPPSQSIYWVIENLFSQGKVPLNISIFYECR